MLFKRRLPIFCILLLQMSQVSADQICFSMAESYYQQLYCEVQAKGKGAGMPSFYDFNRNDEMMQALLLKQFAGRIGVKVVLPKSSTENKSSSDTVALKKSSLQIPRVLSDRCQRQLNIIQCGNSRYILVGNKKNALLAADALTANNRMDLPEYRGSITNVEAVDAYLQMSYYHYLKKMISIGLGGSTLSYGKFAFLFEDLHNKGVSFTERFETMYGYLKNDKKRLAVPGKSIAPEELSLDDCYALNSLMVCNVARNNWLFIKDQG